jgi:hypothetical protein
MINSLIRKPLKHKLSDVFGYKKTFEKNVFRSNFFFNFLKYRKKKWRYFRSPYQYDDSLIFKRFAPNITYVPKYTQLVTEVIDIDNFRINKFAQLLSYKSKLWFKDRLLKFFLIRKTKLLKKFLVFRQINIHFNVFDTNFEILLIRLGIAKTIKQARVFVKAGVLNINGHIVTQTRHLNHLDIVKFSKNEIYGNIYRSKFNFRLKKYQQRNSSGLFTVFNYIRLLSRMYQKYKFLGFLPFTSTFNFSNFSFIYFNFLMKNQWHFFIDFHIAKKFLQYAR